MLRPWTVVKSTPPSLRSHGLDQLVAGGMQLVAGAAVRGSGTGIGVAAVRHFCDGVGLTLAAEHDGVEATVNAWKEPVRRDLSSPQAESAACSVDDSSAFRRSFAADAAALSALASSPPARQLQSCADSLLAATGRNYVTGVGKSAIVAQRLAASLRSLSVPTSFLHATELCHGDLGALESGDLMIMLSHSGGTPISSSSPSPSAVSAPTSS
eukprot:PLAT288.1.p1 GENE.PLAT288.1~~PLAT288.1.p1  ORF type:complete len:212 (-),score=37.42 PLAT288.1:4-639(-)